MDRNWHVTLVTQKVGDGIDVLFAFVTTQTLGVVLGYLKSLSTVVSAILQKDINQQIFNKYRFY